MVAGPTGGIFDLFPKEVKDFLKMEQLEDVLDLQELSIRLAKDPTFINAFDKRKNMSEALKAKMQKYKKQKRNFLATIQGSTGSGKSQLATDYIIYKGQTHIHNTMIKDAYEYYKKNGEILVPSVTAECRVEWRKATMVELEEDRELVHVKTDSGKKCITTVDHSYIILDKDFNIVSKRGDELNEDDRMITVKNIEFPEEDITEKLYEELDMRENGQLFGAYIADGNILNNRVRITKLSHMTQWRPLGKIIEKAQGKYIQQGFSVKNKMNDIGTGSGIKQIPTWFLSAPREFREGVIDGWLSCDGEVTIRNQKRKKGDVRKEHLVYGVNIMTKSKKLAEHGVILLATLGIRAYLRSRHGPINSNGVDYSNNIYYLINFSSSELPKLAEIVELHRGKREKLKGYINKGFLAQDYKDQFPLSRDRWMDLARKHHLYRKRNRFGQLDNTCRHLMSGIFIAKSKTYLGRRKYIEHLDTLIHQEPKLADEPYVKRIYDILKNGGIYLDKIVSIDRLPPTKEKLYDLCVPGTENFMLANGLFLHNSYTMLSLANLISGDQFSIDNIFFRLSDAIKSFDKLEPGTTILIDERVRIWGAGSYRIAAEWSVPGYTMIRCMNETKRIDKIKRGDLVQCCDGVSLRYREVKKVIGHLNYESLYRLHTENGKIECSGHHSIYSMKRGILTPIRVENLKVGDWVAGCDVHGVFRVIIKKIEKFDYRDYIYDIEVNDFHNFIGNNSILYHNSNFTEVIRKFQINILNSTPREMMDVLYTNRFETMPCQIDYVKEFARVAIQDQKKNTLGWIAVRHPKHTVGHKFINEYEKRKDAFLLDIMKHSDKGHIRSLADDFMDGNEYKYLLERFPSGPKYAMIFEAVDQKYPHLQRNQEVAEIARKVEYVQVMEHGMKSSDEKRQERKYNQVNDIDRDQKNIDQYF